MEDTHEPMERQMSQLESTMVKWLKLYLFFQGALLSSVFSAQLPEGSTMGCTAPWRWTPIILSVLASTAMTVCLVGNLFQQFGLFKPGQQELEDLENGHGLTMGSCRLFSAERGWWLLKTAAFVAVFLTFSVCISFSRTRLLC